MTPCSVPSPGMVNSGPNPEIPSPLPASPQLISLSPSFTYDVEKVEPAE